jgi:hypothetical protein
MRCLEIIVSTDLPPTHSFFCNQLTSMLLCHSLYLSRQDILTNYCQKYREIAFEKLNCFITFSLFSAA